MDNVEKVDVLDALYFFKQDCDKIYSQLPPILQVTSPDSDITVSNGTVTLQPAGVDGNVYSYTLIDYGNWTASGTYKSVTVNVDSCKIYKVDLKPYRFGYRINKNESDPYAAVEYLFDAVGMTPAKMNFSAGVFEYGSWADVWFVTDNKPCMLKSNGSVDYYLNPNDYTKKEDGTPSAVSNSNYDGNAMAQIPLCWVYRYEDDNYYYEIVSNVQYDENYKAYAHTDKNGVIKDFCYYAMFVASGSAAKLRSLSGFAPLQSTFDNYLQGINANGEGWYPAYWSLTQLIRTLCVLISKSLDSQSAFGCGGLGYNNAVGTINDKGQFFGFSSSGQSVKVFHIENFFGCRWIYQAGIVVKDNYVYVKMTPEAGGYLVETIDGYTNSNVSIPTAPYTSPIIIKSMNCSELGMIPSAAGASTSTYFCDAAFANRLSISGAMSGGTSYDSNLWSGIFAFNCNHNSTNSGEYIGEAIAFV